MKMTMAVAQDIISVLTDIGGAFDPAALFFGVFQDIVDNGLATVLADVTQATGAMATRQAADAWGPIYQLNDGRIARDLTPVFTFQPANAGEAQTIKGWFAASALAAGTLKLWANFPEPMDLTSELTHVSFVIRVTVDPAGKWSAEIVWNG